MGWGDLLQEVAHRGRKEIENRLGYTPVSVDRLEALEAINQDYRAQSKELDLLGWHVLDQMSGSPHEMKPKKRVEAARQARMAWMYDPMAGRYTDLMNDFVFGRGVPPPRARNPEVQKVIDSAWKDPDNAAVLTGYQAQVAMGTDLTLQSNIFVLIFADGEDGKVKLGLLDHDKVFDAVRDPENRLRVLYYVATYSESEWDFDNNCLKPVNVQVNNQQNVRYYAHWKNVEDAEAEVAAGIRKRGSLPTPKPEQMGQGVVFHIALNRTTEQVFGVPVMQRSVRWLSAYNDLMSARVDMAKAASELIMKRKTKGSPTALARIAQNAVGRGGEIASIPEPTRVGGRPAGTIVENENVTHDPFKLDSGAANAATDATAIRSQISAATGLPQHYLGDQGNANLATATAMDLPVTKMVESRQELFEQLFRAFTDLVIARAVYAGQLTGVLPGEEDAEVSDPSKVGEALNDGEKLDGTPDSEGSSATGKTDLSYEFKMPNPLRRLMSDLATSLQTIAKTFDPNGTNVELSRTLLTIALGEALELQDPSDAVERIFPPGYQDPLVKMELEAGSAPNPAAAAAGLTPGGGVQRGGLTVGDLNAGGGTQAVGGEPGSGKRGPYGTKSGGTNPEAVKEALLAWQQDDPEAMMEALAHLVETRFDDLPEAEQRAAEERLASLNSEFDQIVGTIAGEVASGLHVPALTP